VEIIKFQLNEFNALRQCGRVVPEYESKFIELHRYAPHINKENLKVNKFCSASASTSGKSEDPNASNVTR
jgi:hypothetical protein